MHPQRETFWVIFSEALRVHLFQMDTEAGFPGRPSLEEACGTTEPE